MYSCSLCVCFGLLVVLFSRCQAVLGELLSGVKQYKGTVSYAAMINIIALHSQSTGTCIMMSCLLLLCQYNGSCASNMGTTVAGG